MNERLITPAKKLAASNPFYGMSATLSMLQQCSKMVDKPSKSTIFSYLQNAWKECISDTEKRKLFFSVLFSFGDITNREHNIFRKKGIKNPDSGGNSLRKVFLYCLEWMHSSNPEQFYAFLPMFGEYYNLGANTLHYILWTDRFKGTVTETFRINVDIERLTTYIASVLSSPHTTDNELKLWAKWLWHVPTPKRTRKFVVTEKGLKSVQKKYGPDYRVGDIVKYSGEKQLATKTKDRHVLNCISSLSTKMSWKIIQHKHNVEYAGYREFRKKYLADSEATLFSTQLIRKYDKAQLMDWFETLPSSARYNVQRRLCSKVGSTDKLISKGKWINDSGDDIGKIYLGWIDSKEKAQQELRNLSTEEKKQLAAQQPDVLKAMEKAAKVNTGATTLLDTIADLFKGGNKATLDIIAQSILDKVKVDVPVLVIADTSGSMSWDSLSHKGVTFTALQMAHLAATVFLLKNPSEDLHDMLIEYNSTSRVITGNTTAVKKGANRFMSTSTVIVDNIVDRKKSFIDNYKNIASLLHAHGGTNISTVSNAMKSWVELEPAYKAQRIEEILQYPVFLFISDGDFNSMHNAAASLTRFQQEMRQWFGWEGVTVVWDVQMQTSTSASKFENVPNVIYYGGCNPGILNQIFLNIDDLDIIDVYTVLKSFYESNRYQPIRELVK